MEQSKKGIDFKPITAGLGFHPFSDGLPYAPVSKASPKPQAAPHTPTPSPAHSGGAGLKRDSMGTGALSAGKPTFNYVPRVAVPVAATAGAGTLSGPQVSLPLKKSKVTPTAQVKNPPAFAEPKYGVVYMLKRVFAFGLDTVFNFALLGTALSFAILNEELGLDIITNPGILLVTSLFFLMFNWALITAQEVAFGTSVGKRIFGLVVHGSTSAVFLRAFFFLPSVGFCGVGLLWALFDKQHRCWHDVVVNVQPAEVARL